MPLASSLSIAATAEQTSALDLVTGTAPLRVRHAVSLVNGTGAGAADRLYSDRRTLAASATEDLDLAGVLTDAFGASITFARIKGLIISASAANTNNVIIGNATSNAWAALLGATGTVTLRPGACLGVMAGPADVTGYAVTAGTGDVLKVANSAGGSSVTYDVVLIGASA
jgi:hypothetical protein